MKKIKICAKFIILLAIVLISIESNALESINDSSIVKNKKANVFPANSFYIEFAGLGRYYTLNYERSLFTINNNNISLRTGVGYYKNKIEYFKTAVFEIKHNHLLTNYLMLSMGVGIAIWEIEHITFSK